MPRVPSSVQSAHRLAEAWGVRLKVSTDALLADQRPHDALKASVTANTVRLEFRTGSTEIRLGDVVSVDNLEPDHGRTDLSWPRLRLRHVDGVSHISVRSPSDANRLKKKIGTARRDWWNEALAARIHVLRSLNDRLTALADPQRYVDVEDIRDLQGEAQAAVRSFPGRWPNALAGSRHVRVLRKVLAFLEAPGDIRTKANNTFVANELERSLKLFDGIKPYPPTNEQRRAIVVDGRRNLVMAPAGSGKTAVLVAKVEWLVERGFQSPDELLLLAFAKEAREEMEKRIRKRLGTATASRITVRTFHSLGLAIIGKTEKQPSLAVVAGDSRALLDQLKGFVADLRNESEYSAHVLSWFQDHLAPNKSQHEFKSLGEYYDYLRKYDLLRTLGGDKVRSYQELRIANFLYLNSIRYEYEAHYPHVAATKERRRYRPDFHLSDHGIYIEHFGIDAKGRTAPYVDRKKYHEDMSWKRRVHQDNGTTLIETFSYEDVDGRLLLNLARKLKQHSVTMSPVAGDEVFAVLEEQGRISPLVKLMATFLRHFKGSRLSFHEITKRVVAHRDRARTQAFLRVFRPVYERYQKALSGEIDYEDMVNRSADLVEAGRFRSPFRYILVDEFQDISPARARLLSALLDSAPDTRLFAVGDDWQAIYRFAGSDLGVMRGFKKHFGAFARSDLKTTFRCSDRLANVATEFVLRNKAQSRRAIEATREADGPAVHVGLPGGHQKPLLEDALERIAQDASRYSGTSDVLLLSRYVRQKPRNMRGWTQQHPKLRFVWKTVHRSKGLEADYVIVLGLCSGRYGFPSEIDGDPILDLVLTAPEKHPNAEERRLLYVAITRAKRMAFLLADRGPPSTFVQELIGFKGDVEVFGRPPEGDVACPHCIEGRLRIRENSQDGSIFQGCSNYPLCEYRVRPCDRCGAGFPVKIQGTYDCPECDASVAACPQCGGRLVDRESKFGPFLGCSNWPECNYKRDLSPS